MAPVQSRMHIPHFPEGVSDPGVPNASPKANPALQFGLAGLLIGLAIVLLSIFVQRGLKRRRLRQAAAAAAAAAATGAPVDMELLEALQAIALEESRTSARTFIRRADPDVVENPAPAYTVFREGEAPPDYSYGSVPPPSYKSRESLVARPEPVVLANH